MMSEYKILLITPQALSHDLLGKGIAMDRNNFYMSPTEDENMFKYYICPTYIRESI